MALDPPVKRVAAVLGAHAEYCHVVERLLLLTKFLDLALLD